MKYEIMKRNNEFIQILKTQQKQLYGIEFKRRL